METPQPTTRSLTDTLELTNRALACPPPVDPAIPLDGFDWDAGKGLFVDGAAGYVFDPSNSVFRQTSTHTEYVYDVQAGLFRPRQSDGPAWAPALKLESLGKELSSTAENISSRTAETFTSLFGSITRRAVSLAEEITPRGLAAAAPGAAAPASTAASAAAVGASATPSTDLAPSPRAQSEASGSGGAPGSGVSGCGTWRSNGPPSPARDAAQLLAAAGGSSPARP